MEINDYPKAIQKRYEQLFNDMIAFNRFEHYQEYYNPYTNDINRYLERLGLIRKWVNLSRKVKGKGVIGVQTYLKLRSLNVPECVLNAIIKEEEFNENDFRDY